MKNSLCFGGYVGSAQVAFARVISDYATFANLGDVFVLPKYRGKGYSGELMRAIIAHPNLQGLRRTTLATRNAHGLYAQFGFTATGLANGALFSRCLQRVDWLALKTTHKVCKHHDKFTTSHRKS